MLKLKNVLQKAGSKQKINGQRRPWISPPARKRYSGLGDPQTSNGNLLPMGGSKQRRARLNDGPATGPPLLTEPKKRTGRN